MVLIIHKEWNIFCSFAEDSKLRQFAMKYDFRNKCKAQMIPENFLHIVEGGT